MKKYYWVHLLYSIDYDNKDNHISTELVNGYITIPSLKKTKKLNKSNVKFKMEKDGDILL